jgi:hypothetical protein
MVFVSSETRLRNDLLYNVCPQSCLKLESSRGAKAENLGCAPTLMDVAQHVHNVGLSVDIPPFSELSKANNPLCKSHQYHSLFSKMDDKYVFPFGSSFTANQSVFEEMSSSL